MLIFENIHSSIIYMIASQVPGDLNSYIWWANFKPSFSMFSEYSKLVHLNHSTQPSSACLLYVEMHLQRSYIGQKNLDFKFYTIKVAHNQKFWWCSRTIEWKYAQYFIYFTIKQSSVEDFLATDFFNEQCFWLTRYLQFHPNCRYW